MESRLAALEKNLALARDEADARIDRLTAELGAARRALEKKIGELSAADRAILGRLEDFAVGDVHWEFVGLTWVALGTVLTNIAQQICGLFGYQ